MLGVLRYQLGGQERAPRCRGRGFAGPDAKMRWRWLIRITVNGLYPDGQRYQLKTTLAPDLCVRLCDLIPLIEQETDALLAERVLDRAAVPFDDTSASCMAVVAGSR